MWSRSSRRKLTFFPPSFWRVTFIRHQDSSRNPLSVYPSTSRDTPHILHTPVLQ